MKSTIRKASVADLDAISTLYETVLKNMDSE